MGLVFALGAEDLDAVILAVGDVNPAVVVHDDVVHDVELAVAGPRFSPRKEQPAVGSVLVHPGVGITVGYVELAGAPVEGHVGRHAEGLAAHFGARLVRRAPGLQQLAFGGELADRAVAVVHAEDGIVGGDGNAVGVGEHAFAPGAQYVPIGVEYDHRDSAPVEHVHLVPGVDGD